MAARKKSAAPKPAAKSARKSATAGTRAGAKTEQPPAKVAAAEKPAKAGRAAAGKTARKRTSAKTARKGTAKRGRTPAGGAAAAPGRGSRKRPVERQYAEAAAGAGASAGLRAQISRSAFSAVADAAMASRRAVVATPLIVQKAASILEEEVALGIGAAKRIEQRFLDVEALRAQPPEAVMSRFRRDAHEAIDIILDIITAAAHTVGEQAGRFVNVTASGPRTASGQTGAASEQQPGVRLAVVRMAGKVEPGGEGELAMALENGTDESTAEFTLHAAELVSAAGGRIPSTQVSFSPDTLRVGPHSSGQVTVRVRVPAKTPPGVYEGLVRATQLDALRALLSVEVG